MLSRAAALPRVCLSCRLTLSQRSLARQSLRNGCRYPDRPASFASDDGPRSKELVEALISGSTLPTDLVKKPRGKGPVRKRFSKGARGGGPADREPARNRDHGKDGQVGHAPSETSPGIPEIPHLPEQTDEIGRDTPSQNEPSDSAPPLAERVFRHDLLKYHHLGVDALGKPVEALMLKNPNKMKRPRKQIPVLEEPAAVTGVPIRWQDLVPSEGESEANVSAQIRQNIEELRPTDGLVFPRKHIYKLIEALVRGFTREQLNAYFNHGGQGSELQASSGPCYPWIVRQEPWKAAHKNDWATLKPKQQQAVLILTAKWGLEVQEQVENMGRFLIWLQPHVFDVITRPSNRILESLSADFLDKARNERITHKHEDCRLGIYAQKPSIPLILSRIDNVVQSIVTKSVPVHDVEHENLSEPVLKELGRITNTYIEYNPSESSLSVSRLAENGQGQTAPSEDGQSSAGMQSEDAADVVFRLLNRWQTEPLSNNVHIIAAPDTAGRRKGVFVEHQREERSMSWRDKLRCWSRLASPVAKGLVVDSTPLDLAERVSLPGVAAGTPAHQNTTLMATFGHVLHSQKIAREAKMAKNRRILSPVVPHPASLTSVTADSDSSALQSTAIILNFSPDPEHARPDRKAAPQVRLTLPVNPDADLSKFAFPSDSVLECVVARSVDDILLPDASVDVRIEQRQRLPLDTQQQSLKDFLAVSEFNLLAGRLRTPSRAVFAVPRQWPGPDDQPPSEPEPGTGTPYLFMGLEIHQVVDVEWRGHTLRYNSIEAGQHGGQRQELSLLAAPPGSRAPRPTAEQARDLVRLAGEVAAGQHFSWDKGFMLMQERVAEEFTWDMMDESFDGREPPAEDGGASEDGAEGGSASDGVDGAAPAEDAPREP